MVDDVRRLARLMSELQGRGRAVSRTSQIARSSISVDAESDDVAVTDAFGAGVRAEVEVENLDGIVDETQTDVDDASDSLADQGDLQSDDTDALDETMDDLDDTLDEAAAALEAHDERMDIAEERIEEALSRSGGPTISLAAPTVEDTASKGATWWQRDESGKIIGQWEQADVPSGSTWEPREVASELIANLDVGKLTAGDAEIDDLVAQNIASATGQFLELDVGQLIASDAVIDEAVILKLQADVVTANVFTGREFLGGTFTGATFRTAASGSRVQLDSTGVGAYNALGQNVMQLSATGLTVKSAGEINIDGGSIYLGQNGVITSHTDGGVVPAFNWGTQVGTGKGLHIGGPRGNIFSAYTTSGNEKRFDLGWPNSRLERVQISTDYLEVVADTQYTGRVFTVEKVAGAVPGRVGIKNNVPLCLYEATQSGYTVSMAADGNDGGMGALEVAVHGTVRSTSLRLEAGLAGSDYLRVPAVYGSTTTGGANVRINASGALVRSTSVKAAKIDVADAASPGLLSVAYRSWLDKQEMIDAVLGRGEKPSRRIVGAVAEEMALAAPELCTYDDAGDVTGIAYDRVALALIPHLRDLTNRVEALEGGPVTSWPVSPTYDDTALLDEVTAYGQYDPMPLPEPPTPEGSRADG